MSSKYTALSTLAIGGDFVAIKHPCRCALQQTWLVTNHFAHPPQPQREPTQGAAYCPTNMHRNEKLLLLWWDVAVVARHVVLRYKKHMYLFKRSKPAPHVIRGVSLRSLYLIRDVCTNKGAQSKIPTWSTIMQVAVTKRSTSVVTRSSIRHYVVFPCRIANHRSSPHSTALYLGPRQQQFTPPCLLTPTIAPIRTSKDHIKKSSTSMYTHLDCTFKD